MTYSCHLYNPCAFSAKSPNHIYKCKGILIKYYECLPEAFPACCELSATYRRETFGYKFKAKKIADVLHFSLIHQAVQHHDGCAIATNPRY